MAGTCLLWSFCALSHFSRSFPFPFPPEASFCPELREHTTRGNPGKWRAATSEDLSESSCPTSVVGPARLNKAPEKEMERKKVCSLLLLQNPVGIAQCFHSALTIWQRERLWLTSFSNDRISISSLPSRAFILSCLLANLEEEKKKTFIDASSHGLIWPFVSLSSATRGQCLPQLVQRQHTYTSIGFPDTLGC